MRRIELVLAVLLVLVCSGELLADRKMRITGYGPSEFAIKGDIQPQVANLIRDIKEKERSDRKIHIWVEGFADKTGSAAENDEVAEKRKNQIHAVLSRIFPDAKINSISRGFSENERAVIVEWKYVSPSTVVTVGAKMPEEPAKKFNILVLSKSLILACIFLALVLIVSTLIGKWWSRRATKTGWVDITINGLSKFSVEVEYKNGKLISPFRSKSGSPIIRDSLKSMVDSLKGCLTKEEFIRQVHELLATGKIKSLNR